MSVYDVNGKKLEVIYSDNMSAGTHTFIRSFEGYKAGAYYIRIKTGIHVHTRRFVIAR